MVRGAARDSLTLFSKRDASTLFDPRYSQSGLARWGKGGNLNPPSRRPDQPTRSITDHTPMHPRPTSLKHARLNHPLTPSARPSAPDPPCSNAFDAALSGAGPQRVAIATKIRVGVVVRFYSMLETNDITNHSLSCRARKTFGKSNMLLLQSISIRNGGSRIGKC